MNRERREAERVRVHLNARWEGVLFKHEGTISDISTKGCFILTSGEVTDGELIRVEIQLPTERWLQLWGEVVYAVEEIGFALRFTYLSDEDQALLAMSIKYLRGEPVDLDAFMDKR